MAHVPHLISDLALILGAAAIALLLFKKLKQPVVLGYIVVGLLVGPHFSFFPSVTELESIKVWAEIGVIFLLFSLGLEFSFRKLVKVGNTALITGLVEIVLMLTIGYSVGKLLNWSQIDSMFLGGIIAISSTTIIFRAFEELNLKHKKFAGVVIGVLVIEDLVAVLLMVLLSTVAVTNQVEGSALIEAIVKLLFSLILWFITGIFILPGLLKQASRFLNDEMLLILSIGLCLAMVLLAAAAGFSPALGAFIMGSLLAETTKAERIEHLFKPVKDLFGAVFFVSVGMLIDPQVMVTHAWPVLLITIAVIFGKTINVSVGALLSGQPLKQSIQAGTSMSQIGEFSFIIASLGLSLKVTGEFLYPIAVGVSVITTFCTPYMMRASEPLFHLVERILPQKWVNSLNRYSTGAQHINAESDWKNVLQSYAQIVVFNVVILVAIILLFKNIIEPLIWISGDVGKVLTAALALVCMGPFLWMLTTRKISKQSYTQLWINKYNRGPMIVLEIVRVALGIALVAFLFLQLFSTFTALLIAFLIMLVSGYIFSRKLHSFSVKIEDRFISNLNIRKNMEVKNPHVGQLLPWDAHLAHVDITAYSELIGKPLIELGLREKYGINIASIERGNELIMVPSKNEKLYPFDRIAVIGTDDQILGFKSSIENHEVHKPLEGNKTAMSLIQVTVNPGFPFLGQTIKDSALREKVNCLIVGIERNGQRMLNPESTMIYELGDTLWIVGDKKKVKAVLS